MTMTMKPGRRLGAIEACPECGSRELSAVFDGEQTNFFCESCGRCWLVAMGWVSHVDPLTCPGCGHQDECLARIAAGSDTPINPTTTTGM